MDQPAQTTAPKRSKVRRRLIIVGVVMLVLAALVYVNNHIYLFCSNFHMVVDRQVYRSARPDP